MKVIYLLIFYKRKIVRKKEDELKGIKKTKYRNPMKLTSNKTIK